MTTQRFDPLPARDQQAVIAQVINGFLAGDPIWSIAKATNMSSWEVMGVLSTRIAERGENQRFKALQHRCSVAAEVLYQNGERIWQLLDAGLVLWAVARTVESTVVGVRSGWIAEAAAGPYCGKAYAEVVRAVTGLDPGRREPVFSVLDAASERLRELRLHVDVSYPPAAGVVATENAIADELDALFCQLEIATDASIGHRTPWAGHGRVLDFGKGLPLRPGLKAVSGGSILDGELRAIRLALGAAKYAYTGVLDGRCAVTVSSDNLTAVRMLNDGGLHHGQSTSACREEVQRIQTLAAHANIQFGWVKGHSDHKLNVLADRLAVMARRHKEAGLPADDTLRMAAGIVEQGHLDLAA
ncbi:RNase H family protein [Pseudarthrobacter sp. S6]|uniref:RNase H family protein n=1 Tax=Pseudarthrobacter sp. S6 TaxID=3418420 RepID=UPI003CF15864